MYILNITRDEFQLMDMQDGYLSLPKDSGGGA
jgi:hypothetical protein